VELLGVYDANGGLRGEVAYALGHLLGRRECALCDVTHSTIRRKPAWDAMVASLGMPLRLRHLTELTAAESAAVGAVGAPVVLLVEDGLIELLLDGAALRDAAGDVERFRAALEAALRIRQDRP